MLNRWALQGATKCVCLALVVFASLGAASAAQAQGITLTWDRNTEPNITGYRIFVGTKAGVYTETFDVPATPPTFVYRNGSMGSRYYFAVAAKASSLIGARSSEVSAVASTTVGGGGPAQAPATDGRFAVPRGAVADCGTQCFVVSELASGLGVISSLAVSADGSVFAVESGRRVVVMRGGAVASVMTAPAGTRLLEVVLDPQFASTGRAFVSQVRERDRSSGELEVVRHRYLDGTLAESAAVIAGITVPLHASARMVESNDGLLYIALPTITARDPYSASVLVFDQNGRVPDGQAAGSPVIGRGFDQPSAMAWDTQSQAVWLAGRNEGVAGEVMSVTRANGSRVLAASGGLSSGEDVAAVAVSSASARRLVLAAGQDLIEVTPGMANALRISLDGYGTPVAVSAAATGERYVAVRKEAAAGATYSVLKVEDGRARLAR
jgi:hypothetical protein